MSCRVGITTDPKRRRQEWEQKYSNLKNWEEHGPYASRDHAQRIENSMASQRSCVSHQGGREPEHGPWYVYYFEY